MMKHLSRFVWGLAAFAGLGLGNGANADLIFQSQYPGGPSVTVTYTLPGGGTATEGTSAAAFVVTPLSPTGSPIQAYCVSLDVQVGYGPDVRHATVIEPLSGVGTSVFPNARFEDVGNRLAFLLVNAQGDSDHNSAAQLAIWYTMDRNFSYTGGTTAVNDLYAADILFTGYDPATQYGGSQAKLLLIDPAFGPYQNLITLTDQSLVPEPTSVVSAAGGSIFFCLMSLFRGRWGKRHVSV